MPQGLQVWDAGVLVVDITDRLTRVAGYQSLPANATGSATVPEGVAWTQLVLTGTADPGSLGGAPAPRITISGSTVSWAPPPNPGLSQPANLIYGAY
jgi:hypothetical protein